MLQVACAQGGLSRGANTTHETITRRLHLSGAKMNQKQRGQPQKARRSAAEALMAAAAVNRQPAAIAPLFAALGPAAGCADRTCTGSGLPGLQAASQAAASAKLFALPLQPPITNSWHWPTAGFQNQRGMLPRHRPASAGRLQPAGLEDAEGTGKAVCFDGADSRSLRACRVASLQRAAEGEAVLSSQVAQRPSKLQSG